MQAAATYFFGGAALVGVSSVVVHSVLKDLKVESPPPVPEESDYVKYKKNIYRRLDRKYDTQEIYRYMRFYSSLPMDESRDRSPVIKLDEARKDDPVYRQEIFSKYLEAADNLRCSAPAHHLDHRHEGGHHYEKCMQLERILRERVEADQLERKKSY